MEENIEVKSAREIAIVVAIILVCFLAGIFVYEKFIYTNTSKDEPSKKVENIPTQNQTDYSVYSSKPELNNFYQEFGYKDIRTLGQNYTTEQAKKDNCFVKIHVEKQNEDILDVFNENIEKGAKASLRVVETTIEGDLIITDIKYDEINNKVMIVRDFTRDKYMNKDDAIITYAEYEKIEVYEYNAQNYLVIHNGELDDYAFENGTTNVIISI